MATVQNFPFAAIMLYLAGGVTCCVLKPKASKVVCLLLNSLVTVLMFADIPALGIFADSNLIPIR